eukprot:5190504-Prymnesium_polylepis.3
MPLSLAVKGVRATVAWDGAWARERARHTPAHGTQIRSANGITALGNGTGRPREHKQEETVTRCAVTVSVSVSALTEHQVRKCQVQV